MDSGDVGYLEDETFSADACSVIITGVSTHPGYAKNRMENAIKIASEIIAALPKDKLSPETTEHKEGFIHPMKLEAQLESAKIDFIIRDFVTSKLNDHVKVLKDACEKVIINYPNSKYTLNQTEQYRNKARRKTRRSTTYNSIAYCRANKNCRHYIWYSRNERINCHYKSQW